MQATTLARIAFAFVLHMFRTAFVFWELGNIKAATQQNHSKSDVIK